MNSITLFLIFVSILLSGIVAYLYLENISLKSQLELSKYSVDNEKKLLNNCLEKASRLEDDYIALNEQYNDLFRKYSEALDENEFLRNQLLNITSCK